MSDPRLKCGHPLEAVITRNISAFPSTKSDSPKVFAADAVCGICERIELASKAGLLAEEVPPFPVTTQSSARPWRFCARHDSPLAHLTVECPLCAAIAVAPVDRMWPVCANEHESILHAPSSPCPLCAAIKASPMTASEILLRSQLVSLEMQLDEARTALASRPAPKPLGWVVKTPGGAIASGAGTSPDAAWSSAWAADFLQSWTRQAEKPWRTEREEAGWTCVQVAEVPR